MRLRLSKPRPPRVHFASRFLHARVSLRATPGWVSTRVITKSHHGFECAGISRTSIDYIERAIHCYARYTPFSSSEPRNHTGHSEHSTMVVWRPLKRAETPRIQIQADIASAGVGLVNGGSLPVLANATISFMLSTALMRFGHAGPNDMRR